VEESTEAKPTEPLIVEPTAKPKKVAAKKRGKTTAKKVVGKKKVAIKKPTAKDNGKKKIGVLDAAFKVLLASKKSMRIREIIEKIKSKRLWSPPHGGKTPIYTLSSAIQRSIREPDSRFRRAGKGLFIAKKSKLTKK
jgi:hypothetical protein